MTFVPRPGGPLRAEAQSPLVPRPVKIVAAREEIDGVVTLGLDVRRWPGGFAFEPGQFTMLYVFGVGEVAISISGDAGEPQTLLHTLRSDLTQTIAAVGTVTRAMLALGPKDVVGLRGPYGSAWPLAQAEGRDLLLVAGGLGLAPIRPVLYQVLRNRGAFGEVALLYGARSPDRLLFRRELDGWSRRADLQTWVTVDHASPGWTGPVGVVPDLLERASFDPARAVAFVCGPEVMMRFCARALEGCGLDDDRVWLSMERNMKCAVGLCGHCQFASAFVCKDGPVLRLDRVRRLLPLREI